MDTENVTKRKVLGPGEGRVFLVGKGSVYHLSWCQAVDRVWEYGTGVLVTTAADAVGKRRLCASCQAALADADADVDE